MTSRDNRPVYKSWADRPAIRYLCFNQGILSVTLLIVFLALVIAQNSKTFEGLRHAQFDLYQQILPRKQETSPAVIVAIDEHSLQKIGQWPWPRNYLAHLLDAINKYEPAAIGIDLLFPEPDRLSPDRVLNEGIFAQHTFTEEAKLLVAALPSNDVQFARAIADAPVVLGVGGSVQQQGIYKTGTMPVVNRQALASIKGVAQYQSFIHSLPSFENVAWGHGLLAGPPDNDGVVRRVPVISQDANGNPFPSLTAEMLRVAIGANWHDLEPSPNGLTLSISGFKVPMRPDGTRYVHFSNHDTNRFISAIDVMEGKVLPEQFYHKLVLVGVTGLGIVDYPATPVAARMPGVEVHAQFLENVFDDVYLQRPGWVPWTEALTFILMSVCIIFVALRLPPIAIVGAIIIGVMAVETWAWGMYTFGQFLIDGALPSFGLLVAGLFMLGVGYADTEHGRGLLRRDLEEAREQAARIEGELSAARRIQLGILPTAENLPDDQRFTLSAMLEPAKAVGGDLYDFFMLDEDRLFIAVGDVSGKGVPASLFMAISKALVKSLSLRPEQTIDEIVSQANDEIARDNPEMLFVTLFAGILDLNSGLLSLCNAGHDAIALKRLGKSTELIGAAGGPPLCAVEKFPYPLETVRLEKDDLLLLSTDGIVEAQNEADELFGQDRLFEILDRSDGQIPSEVQKNLVKANRKFVGKREPFDDLTILLIRWFGN